MVNKLFFLIFGFFFFNSAKTILEPEPLDSIYCSLIFDKDSCSKNTNCMYVEISFSKFYKSIDHKKMCYNKSFIINSMKARIFPENFMSISESKLLEEAKIDLDTDLRIAKNIVNLMNRLVELNKLDFINSIALLE